MSRLTPRVVRLERDAPPVWRIDQEEALAELDADPWPIPDFTDDELDAEWARLTGGWSEDR